jgi:hypothetical protein
MGVCLGLEQFQMIAEVTYNQQTVKLPTKEFSLDGPD